MGLYRIKKTTNVVLSLLLATFLFSSFSSSKDALLSINKGLRNAPSNTLVSTNSNDDSTFNSPEVDSLFLIIAITVLGLTSVIGYYIVTNRKGPH